MARAMMQNRLTHLLSSRSNTSTRVQVSQLHTSNRASQRFLNLLNLEYAQRNNEAKRDPVTKPDCSISNPRLNVHRLSSQLQYCYSKPSVAELLSKWCCQFNDKFHREQAPQFPYYRQRAPKPPKPCSQAPFCPSPQSPVSESCPPPEPACPPPDPCPPDPCDDPCKNMKSIFLMNLTNSWTKSQFCAKRPFDRKKPRICRRPKPRPPKPYPVNPQEKCPRKPLGKPCCDKSSIKPKPSRCCRDGGFNSLTDLPLIISEGIITSQSVINATPSNQTRAFHQSSLKSLRCNISSSGNKRLKRFGKKGKKWRSSKKMLSAGMPFEQITAKSRGKFSNFKSTEGHTNGKIDET